MSWDELPDAVQAHVEAILGGRVVRAKPCTGGFSAGTADVVATDHGGRAFVKAISAEHNPRTPDLLRTEHSRLTDLALIDPGQLFPRPLGLFDDGEWVAVIVEEIGGATPASPWQHADVLAALAALTEIGNCVAPQTWPSVRSELDADFTKWAAVIDDPPEGLDPWIAEHSRRLMALAIESLEHVVGDRVAHLDLRGDNMLRQAEGAMRVIDWPWAARGAPWVDSAVLLLDVACSWGDGLSASGWGAERERAMDEYVKAVCAMGAEPRDVAGLIAGLTGLMLDNCRQPSPPSMPTLRGFQMANAHAGTNLIKRWHDTRLYVM